MRNNPTTDEALPGQVYALRRIQRHHATRLGNAFFLIALFRRAAGRRARCGGCW